MDWLNVRETKIKKDGLITNDFRMIYQKNLAFKKKLLTGSNKSLRYKEH